MYKKVKSSWSKHLDFTLCDLIVLQIAFSLAYISRHGIDELPYSVPLYQQMAILLVLIDIFVVFFFESYKGIMRRGALVEFKCVVKHVTAVVVIDIIYLFLMQESEAFSRSVFLQLWAIGIVLVYAERSLLKKYLKKRNRKKSKLRSVIVVTSSQIVEKTLTTIKEHQYGDFTLTGVALLDQNQIGEAIEDIPVIADNQTLLDYIKCHVVDEVFINLPKRIKLSDTLLNGCIDMGVTVHLKLYKFADMLSNQSVENFAGYTVLSSCIKMATPRQLFLKRAMDIAGGLVGCVITLIATIFVAPMILIQSPGPVFFSQTRVGKNGRKFKIYKFRSMYTDAEERKKELMAQNKMNGLMFKMDNDPRIFPFGNFIRKTSIDELPQFWNVLKGDMSLVGTRPPTVDEYEQYELHHRKRLATKPGLTGMWQVSGRSDITDFEDVVALDTRYITEWNLGLDIKIIFKTIQVVFMGHGSI
ncbi:sugar transferase [Eubacterium callanderi]|uniref:sugar transferase n=1 Tax=Eubacterium callanderi TaxID=53442 RepID=UPI001C10A956|nr:sugar transferase [Eubacterium callanderi]MBU5305032.1 sugar transferase [Eubacterium callanderi]